MKKIVLIVIFCLIALSVRPQDTFFMNVPEEQFNNPYYEERDGITLPFFYLAQAAKKLGYNVKNIKDFNPESCVGCFFEKTPTMNLLEKMSISPNKFLISVWEPPFLIPDSYNDFSPYPILHLADDNVDNITSFKFFYPQPSLKMEHNIPSFKEKKLCTMISGYKFFKGPGELYSARCGIISYFERKEKNNIEECNFEFYGEGGWPARLKTFKGSVAHKRPILKQYRFCICYENCCTVKGYITEKIFDSLVSGCVPVYWGAENIADYVDADCFIDRRNFTSNEELYQFMKKMPKKQYEHYLENIKRYLKSEKAFLFSTEYFIDTVFSHLLPGYDKERVFDARQIEMLKKAHAYYDSIKS